MSNYLKQVRDQYEEYPYPPRPPEIEKTQLQYAHHAALDILNYYHFAGRPNFPEGLRVLIAGGGTGDAAIFLAEQLRGKECNITYLDISTASMQIAQARAEVRGLDNIHWLHGSLLDVASLTEGNFDYIDCSGVLHHLEKPEAGLAALAGVLKKDGVMGLMVYAQYGREMVYRMQRLMRLLGKEATDLREQITTARQVVQSLAGNPAYANTLGAFNYEIQQCGDSGVVDLFLHSHDVAYTVPELHRFVASAGLRMSHLFFNRDPLGNALYTPESYTHDPALAATFRQLPEQDRQATAELLHSRMIKHTFYATRAEYMPALPHIDDLSMAPYFSMLLGDQPSVYEKLHSVFASNLNDQLMQVNIWGTQVQFLRSRNAHHFFQYLDGKRSLRDIFEAVRSNYSADKNRPTITTLHEEFKPIFVAFNRMDIMLLKAPDSAPPLRTVSQMIMEMKTKYTMEQAS